MNDEDMEAFFLNHNDPWYERIQEADTEKEANAYALQALALEKGKQWDTPTLNRVVKRIREFY